MPDNLDTLIHRSFLAIETNNIQQAIELLLQALSLHPKNSSLHNNLATAYKKVGAFNDAEKHYKKAISLNSNYPEAHHNLANLYAHLQQYSQALEQYQLALKVAPDYTLAHYHLGLLFLSYQKKQAAQTQFKNVIELCQDFQQAHFYLGVLALDEHENELAQTYFEHALQLNPNDANTHVNLGVIALQKKQGQEAIHHFTQALSYDEEHIDARNNLAATFIHYDRYENALTHYALLLKNDPDNLEYIYNTGVCEMALGQLQKAREHFNHLLKIQPKHFEALVNLAAIFSRLNQHDNAKQLLHIAHQENPTDTTCLHMLNAIGGIQSANTNPEYAKNLFNNYALYYDTHLQQTLQYKLPQAIGKCLHQLIPTLHIQHALDLGCGTGLSGSCVREMSQQLTGVDISEKMLKQAEAKQIYDTLIESELVDFLKTTDEIYDVIISADVLPYLGDLEPLFKALTPQLAVNGLFIFNIEISETGSWYLQKSARFAHCADYIHTLSEKYQFTPIHQEALTSRQQSGENLTVILFALQNKGRS